MYNINKKSGTKNLYHTARKIWKLSEKNSLTLKAVHISGRINVTTNKLSRLEMNRDYHLNEKMFQRIQRMWRCYPRIDLFESKKNRLIRTYASVIPRNDPINIRNTLKLNWSNIKADYFDYSTGEIQKCVIQGKDYDKGKTSTVTRE
jgi:DNA-binding PucR family transcriptional regulator